MTTPIPPNKKKGEEKNELSVYFFVFFFLEPFHDVNNVNFILGAHSRKFLQHKERFKDFSAEVSVFWLFIDLGY